LLYFVLYSLLKIESLLNVLLTLIKDCITVMMNALFDQKKSSFYY